MKIVLLFSTILCFLVPMSAFSADTVSGVVSDSMTGAPLSGVKVVIIARSCSTFTNVVGAFTLAIPIPTSVVHPSSIPKMVRIQDEGVSVMDLKGCIVEKDRDFSSGFWLLRFKSSEGEFVTRVLNLSSFKRSGYLALMGQGTVSDNQVLAKAAAISYSLSFEKNGYSPTLKLATGGQNVTVKLLPESASGNFQIKTDSLGTLTVTTQIQE